MSDAALVFAGVARVLELHQPSEGEQVCRECGHRVPCPTVQALGVEQ